MCYFIGGKLPQLFGDLFRPSEIKWNNNKQ
jgi:hypothetical protein